MSYVIASKETMEYYSRHDDYPTDAFEKAKLYYQREVENYQRFNRENPDDLWATLAVSSQKMYDTMEVIPEAEWIALDAQAMQAKHPLKLITEERYNEMLNILPPLLYESGCFFMSEFEIGSWTTMFVKYYNDYFERVVDYCNEDTWVTPDQCYALLTEMEKLNGNIPTQPQDTLPQ